MKNLLKLISLQMFAAPVHANPAVPNWDKPLTTEFTYDVDNQGKPVGGLKEILPDGYYSPALLDNAETHLVHDEQCEKTDMPQHSGLVAFWQRVIPLEKALAPLTEGVPPKGTPMTFETVSTPVYQFGGYVPLSDLTLMALRYDMKMVAAQANGDQAGRTLDTVCREGMNAGKNVKYGHADKGARYLLKGGDATEANNDLLTLEDVFEAESDLFKAGAKRFENERYHCIIHPDVQFDLMRADEWLAIKDNDPDDYYAGKIGDIGGVTFYRSEEAKIFQSEAEEVIKEVASAGYLTVSGVNAKVITVSDTLTSDQQTALKGKIIQYFDASAGDVVELEVASATANTITCTENVGITYASGDLVYPGGAGYKGRHVYSTLIMGKKACGSVRLSGGNLQYVWKDLDGPLNQAASSGWKALYAAKVLNDDWIIRIETCSKKNSDCA